MSAVPQHERPDRRLFIAGSAAKCTIIWAHICRLGGDADRILPYPNTGKRLPRLINDMQLVVIEGGPHAITWTRRPGQPALLGFLS